MKKWWSKWIEHHNDPEWTPFWDEYEPKTLGTVVSMLEKNGWGKYEGSVLTVVGRKIYCCTKGSHDRGELMLVREFDGPPK